MTQSRRPFTNPQTGGNNDAGISPLQAIIVKPEQALPIKPFGLDVKVLLTTEATGGAVSVLMGWIKPGEGPGDHAMSISTKKKCSSSSRAPMK